MWQNWVNVVVGLWLAASPWILETAAEESRPMIVNCVVSGLLIATFALWGALSKAEVWQDWVLLLICVWLFLAPGTLEYNVRLVTWNNVLAGFIVGSFALWYLDRQEQRGPIPR